MENNFKVIFLGESGIGAKTSLIKRIIGNKSNTSMSYNIIIKHYLGNEIKLELWDTPGQERYRSINKIFIPESHCVILVFDITNERSFRELNYHYNLVKEYLGDSPIIFLVANKIDLFEEQEVLDEEAAIFAKGRNMQFFRVSAKTGEGVDFLMENILKSLTEKFILKSNITKNIEKNVFNIIENDINNKNKKNNNRKDLDNLLNKNLLNLTKYINH